MTSRLPRAAREVAAAEMPPRGLPGLDPAFSRLVPAAGRTWHVLDTGPVLAAEDLAPEGTILCVHGNPTWSYLWRTLTTAATEQARAGGQVWRVIAVDQLDMGFSERTGLERDLALRVGDLSDLTDALDVTGPVVTFGHDWGGVVSLGWAVDHRDLLAGVMLLNTAVNQPSTSKIPAPLRLALGKGVLGRATVTTPAFLETTLALAHPALDPEVKDAFRAPYRGSHRRGGIGGFVADIPAHPGHESEAERRRVAESIRTLDVPALMLWGPRDPIFSDRYLDDLAGRLPQADIHRFEGAGHLLAEDVPFAQHALTWLGERLGSPSPGLSDSDSGLQDPAASPSTDTAYLPVHAALDDRRSSDEVALVEMSRVPGRRPLSVSWRSLARRVDRLAKGLRLAGVQRGDRVSLLVPPGADLTAVLYACLRIGAVVVVADAGLGVKGLGRAVRGAWPAHIIGALPGLAAARTLGWPGQRISTRALPTASAVALGVTHSLPELASLGAAVAEPLPVAPAADDPAAILFTSGSTGPAKGVAYSHRQLSALCRTLAATYDVGPDTGIVAGFAPFALLGPALGTRSVTPAMDVTSPATLTAEAVASAAAEVDATVLFLSPAALTNVVATSASLTDGHRRALERVRIFLSAGAPVSADLLEQAAALMPGATPHTPYGMTEGLLMTDITLDDIREARDSEGTGRSESSYSFESSGRSESSGRAEADGDSADANEHAVGGVCVGRPVDGVRLLISALDSLGRATGEPVQRTGVTGEILVSAPHLFGHYDRLWLTDLASTRDVPTGARWHRTGDVGHLDVEGRLWIEGRIQHVLSTAQGPVTPVGPEQRIDLTPGVRRSALVGVGPVGAQVAVAVIETEPLAARASLADPELAAAVRTRAGLSLAAVLVAPGLPTDVRHNSKIDRQALAVWAAAILEGGPLGDPR